MEPSTDESTYGVVSISGTKTWRRIEYLCALFIVLLIGVRDCVCLLVTLRGRISSAQSTTDMRTSILMNRRSFTQRGQ